MCAANGLIFSHSMLLLVGVLLALAAELSKGDFTLPNGDPVEDEYAAVRAKPTMRSKKMLKSPERLWPRAAVIYKFDATLRCPESYKCTIIMDAMDHIMEKTCVRFKEWSGERDFVRIEETASASGTSLYATSDSSLGKVRGEQTIRIHPKAWFNNGQGTVLHEMGHTLGLIDEHNHPDRDHYLKILSDNIHPVSFSVVIAERAGALINFQKRDRAVTNILGQPLDFDSVMMYPDYSFSKEPGILKALRSKVGLRYHYKTSLSSRLSAGDVRRIQDLYRCDGSNQKPSFPVDVVCSFDDDSCGFKGLGKNPHWEWIPNTVKFEDGWKGANQQAKESVRPSGGFLRWSLKSESEISREDHLWSVGFYELSPLDKKRGPDGCVKFKYLFQTHKKGPLTIKLVKTEVSSPRDSIWFDPTSEPTSTPKLSTEIWSSTGQRPIMLRYRYWTRVSVSVNVLSPFVLDFVATLKDGVGKYSVKINDLEVRYTPCEKPSPQSKRVDDSPQSKGVDDEAKKRKLGWHKRCFSEPLGSISRSWSSLSRSSRISSPKPST